MKKLLIPMMVLVLAGYVQAGMPNPAAVYCDELGYQVKTITEEEGGQYSVCVFPDDNICDAWEFLKGKCGEKYSYCAKNGYGQVIKTDGKNSFTRDYPVCVDESTEIGNPLLLMGITERLQRLSFLENELPTVQPSTAEDQDLLESLKAALPASFDWRTYNGFDWMTPVKDQSACGSCWAFGSTGTVEAVYNLRQNQPNLDINLSEEYVSTDCNGNGKSGCCGGRHEQALEGIRDNGVPDDMCLVYDVALPNGYDSGDCLCDAGAGQDECRATCPNGAGTSSMCSLAFCDDACFDVASRLVDITDFYDAGATDRDLMKANLIAHGPLTAALLWDWSGGGVDGNGVHSCGCGNSCGTNHCVIITGWDDALGAWIIKNSHGNNDGPAGDGYRLIAYGDCNLETRPVWVEPSDIYFPSISVPNGIDFGDNCVDGTSYETLNICNTGMANLSVFEIASDDVQFQVTTPLMDCHDLDGDGIVEVPDECSGGYPVNISPDFCYPFQVEFTPTGPAGQRTATLTVRSGDIGKPNLSVPANGYVAEPDIAVAIADSGNFGDVCTGAFGDLNLSLLNQGDCDLTISSISSDDSQFALPVDTTFPLILSPDADFNLPIRFEPDACGSALVTGTITINSDDPDEGSLRIDVSGSSPCPDIQVAIANSGDFGAVCKGDYADLNLTLFNQGKCDLTISNIELLPDAGSFELPADLNLPLVLSADADFNLPVRFSPDVCFDAPEVRTVRITSDDPNEPAVDINVSGVSPCPNLIIDPTSLIGLDSFPATVVDTGGTLNCFSERSLVLRNNSICPLTITSISAAGDDYLVTQPTVFPILLPGGEEVLKADVRFLPQSDGNPTMPGEIAGQLTVVSDDPDGDALAGLCGESVAQSGVRILVTDQSGAEPQPLDMVERITLKSQGIRTPAPVNLVFTDQALLSATICGNEILYHVNQETLPATDTVHNPNSSYDAKAKDGNLQALQNFNLGQCEFRDFQLQLDDADATDCLLLPKGASCTSDGECCSGKCKGPNGRKTCK